MNGKDKAPPHKESYYQTRIIKWLKEQYPDELASYTCRMKLYFAEQNREKFFETLETLKRSDVLIDNETLELIRIFSS